MNTCKETKSEYSVKEAVIFSDLASPFTKNNDKMFVPRSSANYYNAIHHFLLAIDPLVETPNHPFLLFKVFHVHLDFPFEWEGIAKTYFP